MARDVDPLPRRQSELSNVLGIDENDAPAVVDAAIAIIETVHDRIELIVAPYGGHEQLAWAELRTRECDRA